MGHRVLYLKVDDQGIIAFLDPPGSGAKASILFEDIEPGSPVFDPAMSVLEKKMNLEGCNASVVLLPDDQFSFRTLVLPFSGRRNIRKVLDFELAPCLPREDISYESAFHVADYQPDENLVLTASFPKDRIRAMTRSLLSRKLPPIVIAPEDHAATAACFIGEPGNRAYVSIGRHRLTLTIAAGEIPIFARAFMYEDPDWDKLVSGITASLTGFFLRFGRQEYEIIIIPLDTAKAGEELEHALERSGGEWGRVTRVSPGNRLGFPDSDSLPKGILNLADAPFGPKAFIRDNKAGIWAAGILAAAVFCLFTAGIWMETSRLEDRIHARRTEAQGIFLQVFPDKGGIMGPSPLLVMESLVAREERQGPQEALAGLAGPGVARVLTELSLRISREGQTAVTRLNMNKGQLSLTGTTTTFNQVDRIKTELGASSLFKTVTITNAQADKSGGKIRFKFALTL